MLTLPETYCTPISRFARIFSKRVWRHAQVLLIGAILAPGKRTVTSALHVMGLSDEQHFQNYHRVLSRAVWSSLEVSRILLMLLVNTFVPKGPVVMGIDETIERRRGAKIKAKGGSGYILTDRTPHCVVVVEIQLQHRFVVNI